MFVHPEAIMTRNRFFAVCSISLLALAACEGDDVRITGPKGQEAFERYVSIGTSVSMGVQSAGATAATAAAECRSARDQLRMRCA